MAFRDSRGVPVSTRSHDTLDRYEIALRLVHGYSSDAMVAIDEALANDPAFIMGYCLRAGLMVMAADKKAETQLRRSVETAETLWSSANLRERGHIAAARAWLDGNFERAVKLYGCILADYPRDSAALQFAHVGDLNLGQSTMLRDRIARVLPEWDDNIPGYGHVLGMHAFGLEETGAYSHAEEIGRKAVDLVPEDVWGLHAVAHVLETQGRLCDGVQWMAARTRHWAKNNTMATHNWWHLALFYLDLGCIDRVLKTYDHALKPDQGAGVQDMIDASALLWRLHLGGVHVASRWSELADHWEPLAEDGYYAFNDMHAMMAFVASGREDSAQRLAATLERELVGTGTNARMIGEVGLPVCLALRAFGYEDYATAIDLLLRARPVAHRIGGADVQRDVLNLTLIEAALRGGQGRLARALLAERTGRKPGSPHNWATAARAMDLLGEVQAAERARARATSLKSTGFMRR